MINQNQPKASLIQQIVFFSGSFISTLFLCRNLFRIRRYSRSYRQVKKLMSQKNSMEKIVGVLKGGKSKEELIIDGVKPKFSSGYFKDIDCSSNYEKKVGKFYQGLSFEKGFEGKLRIKGIEHTIWFKMHKPIVGYEIASAAQYLESKGKHFHQMQMICLLGSLKYSDSKKRGQFDTKMLVLDLIDIDKYWQTKIVATILSSFYFGVLLGLCYSIFINKSVLDEETVDNLIKTVYQAPQQKQKAEKGK